MNKELLRIYFSLLIFSFPLTLFLRFFFSKQTTKMLKDMTGENGRWDWSEIWQSASLFMALGSWFVMITMIFLVAAFSAEFPIEAWIVVAVSTAGSNGVEALIIYVKGKYGAKGNNNESN